MQREHGFTLIELLVVIAIIGILSTVVLASLNTARAKGADAAIRQTMNSMRAAAELYYDANLSYLGMCDDAIIQKALASADTNNASGAVQCVDGDDVTNKWAMEAQLVHSSTEFYCADNNGTAGIYIGSTVSNTSGSEDSVCGP